MVNIIWNYILDDMSIIEDDSLETDMLRRKWIVNTYTGITPTITFRQDNYRIDLGSELRFYTGDHYGEVKDFFF